MLPELLIDVLDESEIKSLPVALLLASCDNDSVSKPKPPTRGTNSTEDTCTSYADESEDKRKPALPADVVYRILDRQVLDK